MKSLYTESTIIDTWESHIRVIETHGYYPNVYASVVENRFPEGLLLRSRVGSTDTYVVPLISVPESEWGRHFLVFYFTSLDEYIRNLNLYLCSFQTFSSTIRHSCFESKQILWWGFVSRLPTKVKV